MISKFIGRISFLVCMIGMAPAAMAAEKLSIITSIPDLAWLASEIGGSRVNAKALLNGNENPHYVDAVPEFIRLAANADVVCVVGLELEIGYMPVVLSRSGNSAVQPGGKGYCDASKSVAVLDKPAGPVDRSMGDVHPTGNPHYYLSPKAMSEAAVEVTETLVRVDPKNAGKYRSGLVAVADKLGRLSDDSRKKLAAFTSTDKLLVIEYHKEFTYFLDHYGLKSFGSIEEKPGVPPSAGRIAEVAMAAKAAGVNFVLATDYSPTKTLTRFSELSGIPVVIAPTMIQPSGKHKTYEDLQRSIVNSIVATLAEKQRYGKKDKR